jgi:hypothetical protein
MSKPINLGCSNIDNIVHFLRNEYNVVKPYITFQEKSIITNFDWYYSFDDDLLTYTKIKNSTSKVIGYPRLPKYEQTILLSKLNICTPKTYRIVEDGYIGNRDDAYYEMLEHISDDEKILLKADNGARGIGQVLLTKNQLYELVDECGKTDVDIDELLEKYEVGAKGTFRHDGEKSFFREAIMSNDFSIQEMVNLSEEYRFIYFHGCEPIIIQRKVGKSWQANTSITGEGSYVKFDQKSEKHSEMQKIAEKISNYTTMPIISIDFYVCVDTNKIGIFEFQSQFGYKLVPKSELTKKTKLAIKNMINEKIVK